MSPSARIWVVKAQAFTKALFNACRPSASLAFNPIELVHENWRSAHPRFGTRLLWVRLDQRGNIFAGAR